ncbi:MAG: TolC family protein [Pirellulales bacterium]
MCSYISRFLCLLAIGTAPLGTGCRAPHQIESSEYCQLARSISRSMHSGAPVEVAIDPVVEEWSGAHPVEWYIGIALAQNPAIQAARMEVESLAQRVPQAASLQDPTLATIIATEPIQTAAGQQDLSLQARQKLPWLGKLAVRAEVAEQQVQMGRAQLASVELSVVEKVKRAYYRLYFVQQAIRITKEDKKQLELIETVVDRKYRVERKVTQQDLLNVQVAVSQLETDLIKLRQQLASTQSRLAEQLHISPDTQVRAVDQLAPETLPVSLADLYLRAIASRPELHAALAAVARDQTAVDLARLNYYPDLTLGATWVDISASGISPVANSRDAILIGASINVPIYRKRLRAGVREAEAKAVSSARKYDSLKDQTQSEVKDLFAQATSQQELLLLFREDILPKAQQSLVQSISAYQVGKVDFLQMIDNWRDLLRFEITAEQLEAELRQSLASLARAVGTVELGVPDSVVGPHEVVALPPAQPEENLPGKADPEIRMP